MGNTFQFALGQSVLLSLSGESGIVRGRAEYSFSENNYLVAYKAADGRQVEQWWTESQINAAE